MSKQSTALLPCPFCGGRAEMNAHCRETSTFQSERRLVAVRCQSCAAQGPWSWTESAARAGWERRPELQFDARGLPVLTELEQADALRACIAAGATEDAIGHLLDLLARFQVYGASSAHPFEVRPR